MAANWYCIRTATRQEQRVVDGLHDLAYEHRLDIDVYLPCETRWNRLTRVKTIKHVPMLPGYLFLSIDPDQLWRVDQIEGVYQILGWGIRRTAKETSKLGKFVKELRDDQAAGAFDRTNRPKAKRHHGLKVGQPVRVRGGPFIGFSADIAELSGPDRVRLLLSIFGRETPIEVDADDVEAQDNVASEAA